MNYLRWALVSVSTWTLTHCSSAPPRASAAEGRPGIFVEAVVVDVPAGADVASVHSPAAAHRLAAANGSSSSLYVLFSGERDGGTGVNDHGAGGQTERSENLTPRACERYEVMPGGVDGKRVAIDVTTHTSDAGATQRRTLRATDGELSYLDLEPTAVGRRRLLYVRPTIVHGFDDVRAIFRRQVGEAGGEPFGRSQGIAFPDPPSLSLGSSCVERP